MPRWAARRPARWLVLLGLVSVLGGCMTPPGQALRITDDPKRQPARVTVAEGTLRGVRSDAGTVFLGVPFAAPPVGDRRFAAPAPPAAWSGVRDATHLAPRCPQSVPFAAKSEDCLYLDVYVPPDTPPGAHLPVMVWLYGGGLIFGSNAQYDGSRLADAQDVIVVVPNYRLGALGFFAHPALAGQDSEGNYGILDQRAALAWVTDNIDVFGGDPARVTLFGQSAGAASACTHMVSPGSQGLFDRVILESDTCVFPDQWVSRTEAENGGVQTAADLGCDDADDVLACLRGLPADDFVGLDSHHWGNTGKNGWSPMVGAAVLPTPPRERFAHGKDADVALLMGTNRTEGRFFSNLLTLVLAWRSRASYESAVAKTIRPEIREQALAAYDDIAAQSYGRAFAAMVTDSHFACPMLSLHARRAAHARVADHAYEFDDPDAPTIIPHVPFAAPQAAYHSAELIYVFDQSILFAGPDDWQPAQRALSQRIQAYWGAFARTGRPEAADQPAWPVFDGQTPIRLSPEGEGMATDYASRHRCAFWHSLGY